MYWTFVKKYKKRIKKNTLNKHQIPTKTVPDPRGCLGTSAAIHIVFFWFVCMQFLPPLLMFTLFFLSHISKSWATSVENFLLCNIPASPGFNLDIMEHCRSPIATPTGVPSFILYHTSCSVPAWLPVSCTDGRRRNGNSVSDNLQNNGFTVIGFIVFTILWKWFMKKKQKKNNTMV